MQNEKSSNPTVQILKIDDIYTHPQMYVRADLDDSTAARYAGEMKRGVKFPPIVVFYDGRTYFLADGFLRVEGARKFGEKTILAEVHQGTIRDAVLFAVSANSTHGLPRNSDDKRHAVTILLKDETCSKWSDEEIARRCNVPGTYVKRIRREITPLVLCRAGTL